MNLNKRVIKSSFLSCEKDTETIIKQLFVNNANAGDDLKRLLVINTSDCLDKSNESYQKIIKNTSVKELINGNYISLVPRVKLKEHEEVKSYINISFDDFTPSMNNPEFRDCTIIFNVYCHRDYWYLGNYQLRPLKILGIIDGILNNSRLSGIGKLNFYNASEIDLNEDYGGYTLIYQAVHGSDDTIPGE